MTKVSFFQPKIKKNKKKGIDHEPRSEDQKNLVNTQHAQTQKNNLHLKSVSVFFLLSSFLKYHNHSFHDFFFLYFFFENKKLYWFYFSFFFFVPRLG